MNKFDTHKFLYTLFHEGRIEGHEVLFLDRENNEQRVEVKSIEIGASPVTCKIFDKNDKSYRIPYIRIRKVFFQGQMVWDNTGTDLGDAKIIKGYK